MKVEYKSRSYECDVCHYPVHYPIPYPFSPGTGYLCHSCMRYLSTAVLLKMKVS